MIRRCRNCKTITTGDACKPCWSLLTERKRDEIRFTCRWLETHRGDEVATRSLAAAWRDAARQWAAAAAAAAAEKEAACAES